MTMGKTKQAAGWTPTVAHLIVLIILEMAAFTAIRYSFRIVQGH